jgi:Holliday junction DNA helicase RuvA
MIAALTGKVFSRSVDRAVIDVSGVGYEVFLSTDTVARMPETGEDILLYVHTHVREDALILFGFLEEEEKELFLILKTVSGIGPKLALAMLSGLKVSDLCRAITASDIKTLTTLQGVGKKTAERICVDLKEKVGHLSFDSLATSGAAQTVVSNQDSVVADVLSALINLGYADPVARESLVAVKKRIGQDTFDELTVEDLIREALRVLA